MRLRDALTVGLLVATIAAGGCSRLTFVKPDYTRRHYRQVAPEYNIREDANDAKRVAAIEHVAIGSQKLSAGQLDQAEAEARAAVQADPTSADAFGLLAMIAEEKGQISTAGTAYARAVALAPARGAGLNNYGVWLCSSGRAVESLALFDRALADPGYGTPGAAAANAGSCALAAGQDARALTYLQYALQLDPASPVALAAMAEHEYRAGHYLQARAFSERRLAAAPASVQVLQLASHIEQKLGDNAAAARYVRRIEQEFPQTRPVSPGDASRQ